MRSFIFAMDETFYSIVLPRSFSIRMFSVINVRACVCFMSYDLSIVMPLPLGSSTGAFDCCRKQDFGWPLDR